MGLDLTVCFEIGVTNQFLPTPKAADETVANALCEDDKKDGISKALTGVSNTLRGEGGKGRERERERERERKREREREGGREGGRGERERERELLSVL